MSGRLIEIYHRILKRETRIPLPIPASKQSLQPDQTVTTPKVGRTSIPTMAGVVQFKIEKVDPEKLIGQIEMPPITSPSAPKTKKITVEKGSLFAKVAAVAAGAVILLAPSLAFAGEASGIISSCISWFGGLGTLGKIGVGAGALLTLKLLWSKYNELKPENYQSKKMSRSFGNPTIHKILKTMVLPAWGTTVIVGSIFAFLPAIEGLLGIPGVLSWGAFGLLALRPVLTILTSGIRDIYQWLAYKIKGVQRNLPRPSLLGMLATDLFAPAAWLATLTFTLHLSKIYATQCLGMLINFISNIPAVFSSVAPLEYGLVFALGLAAYRFFFGWPKVKIGNPIGDLPNRFRSARNWFGLGALLGIGICLAGPGLVVTNLLTFAVTLAFSHSFKHSIRSQEGGLRQAHKMQPIFDLQSLWEDVRSAKGGTRTVFRPAVGLKDSLISGYLMTLITEGANWVLRGLEGSLKVADYKLDQEMIENLLKKDAQVLRDQIKNGYHRLGAAQNTSDAIEAYASTLENTANLLDILARGDLRTRSGLTYLEDSFFCAGLPGSTKNRSDQDLRVHGEHIRFAATICRDEATRWRNFGINHGHLMDLKTLQRVLTEKLEAKFRRAFPPCDVFPRCFYTNLTPILPNQLNSNLSDPYNSKQSGVDLTLQVMADFVGYMDMVVMTAGGQIELWAIPLKVVKDFKPDHSQNLSIESRDTNGEDLRFGWYERAEHDIGNSLCEIAYIDNSAHYNKYQRMLQRKEITDLEFLKLYPTAEVPTPPTLKMTPQADEEGNIESQEFYDVVYKNGTRLRIFADGSQRIIGRLDPAAPTVIMLPGTARHNHIAARIQNGTEQAIFQSTTLDPKLKKLMGEGKVPHPFGDKDNPYFNSNGYVMPRWHFLYPTEYTSISDADQMDLIVTNLRLFRIRKNPHLRVTMVRPRLEKLPYSPDMLEQEQDSFLEVGIAVVWMTLRAKLKDGKTLYIPLNLNKENERTFGGELWRYIDENRPVQIVRKGTDCFLQIPYRATAMKDPAFRNNYRSIEEVPIPIEMRDFVDQIEEIKINPERYGEVGGPRPVADYFIVRRPEENPEDYVTDSERARLLPERIANLLIFGKIALLSKSEIEHWETVEQDGKTTPRENLPWTDENSCVHVKMSDDEYQMLLSWIPAYYGKMQPIYQNGELLISVKHFELLCEDACSKFTYRRFMPDGTFRTFFDSAETEPFEG